MSGASLGVLPSTPVAFLQAEGGSPPPRAILDRRQGAWATRLGSSPSAFQAGKDRAKFEATGSARTGGRGGAA